jgi:hypothetical protein
VHTALLADDERATHVGSELGLTLVRRVTVEDLDLVPDR